MSRHVPCVKKAISKELTLICNIYTQHEMFKLSSYWRPRVASKPYLFLQVQSENNYDPAGPADLKDLQQKI